MILSDGDLSRLAAQFADGGPVQCPEGVDVQDTIARLNQEEGLETVHVAEETEGDGIILMR